MHGAMGYLLEHGYLALFVMVFVEQIGFPVPSAPLLIAAGALAGLNRLNLAHALVSAMSASILSDSFWYYLGRSRGSSILQLLCRISLEPETCVSKIHSVYARYGSRSLLVSKFVPGLGAIAAPMAGLLKLAPWKFILLEAAAAFFWAGSYTGLGWMFRGQLELVGVFLARLGVAIGIAVGAGLALYVAWKYWKRERTYRSLRVSRISPEELKERMDNGAPLRIVDLRDALEWREGRIPRSIHLEAGGQDSLLGLGPETEIVFYCSCPQEYAAAKAAMQLKRLGVPHVRPLQGGFQLWRDLGYPLEDAESAPGGNAVASLTETAT